MPAVTILLAMVITAGCASRLPGWVPLVGRKAKVERPVAPPAVAPAASIPQPATTVRPPVAELDVADRVVAVVNNDAITLTELQESVVYFRTENRQETVDEGDLTRRLLARMIESRLQLQEADRERVVVEEAELGEELADRMRKFNAATREEFEALVKQQGLTMDTVRRKLREQLMISKVVRRKVAFRVSVTEEEIDRHLAANRPKLETGLSYQARHILIPPDGADDAAWGVARDAAAAVHARLRDGEDFGQVAREVSRDGTAQDGGDLGALKQGELAEEIEAEILKLAPGQLSLPFRTELGYHIVKLETRETLSGEALTRVRQQVRELLFREKYQARFEVWLAEIKQRAIIEIRI